MPKNRGGRPRGGRTYEYKGKSLDARGWAEETGLPLATVFGRLRFVSDGSWTMEEALTLPVGSRGRGGARPKPSRASERKPRHVARRSKEDGQLEALDTSPRMAEADTRIDEEIRKLRALVVVPARRP